MDLAFALSAGVPLATIGASLALANLQDSDGVAIAPAIVGVLVGPSLGHWYVGESGWIGLTIRLSGVALMGAAIERATCCGEGNDAAWTAGDQAEMLSLAGLVLIGGGAVYDIISAPWAAHRHNTRLQRGLAIAPWPGSEQIGVAFGGVF